MMTILLLLCYDASYMKKKIIVLIVTTLIIIGLTFLMWPIRLIDNLYIRRGLTILLYLLLCATALVACKLTSIKIDIELNNYWQFIIGLIIACTLSLGIAFIPALLGHSLIGNHQDFDIGELLFYLFFYLVIVGPIEELIFREYYQDTFCEFFKNNKWIGVVIAAALFGLWHLINGSLLQVLFTFGIGLVFGLGKHFIKKFKYLGGSFGHGLYDFLNVIVRMFVI